VIALATEFEGRPIVPVTPAEGVDAAAS